MDCAGYTYLGLCALARAHRANTMAGHLGAALVAGALYCEEHADLDDVVVQGIEGELDRVRRGEETWFDEAKFGVTVPELFEPFPDASSRASDVGAIAAALAANISRLRQSGHNVIFAALALRAFRAHPEYATRKIVAGIRSLTAAFDGAPGGRCYFGEERGWLRAEAVSLLPDEELRPYVDLGAMAPAVMDELALAGSVRRQGVGGLHHLINHAAALLDLSRLGYEDLVRDGLAAHRQHVRIWRALPDLTDELGAAVRAEHDPRTPDYWRTGALRRTSALLTHRIKTIYGLYSLVALVDDPGRRRDAEEMFRYLV